MARSLNRVQLIGNLTRDPELRYTPQGTAVCSFGVATNRSWTTDAGEKRDEADFHRIVAWNKLAELCGQFLSKGKKVFVEGRLSTRNWNAQDGSQRTTTEIIISDMILLDSAGRRVGEEAENSAPKEPDGKNEEEVGEGKKTATTENTASTSNAADAQKSAETKSKGGSKKAQDKKEKAEKESDDEVAPDDIPF